MSLRQKIEKWLRIGIVPSVPADAEDEEPCSPAACILMKFDAARPDWRELAAVTGWLMKSHNAPEEVAEIVMEVLRETGRTEGQFNREFERRIAEYRSPYIDAAGIHGPMDHRRDVELCCALEVVGSFLHHRAAA